jgi:outer membrane usher protein
MWPRFRNLLAHAMCAVTAAMLPAAAWADDDAPRRADPAASAASAASAAPAANPPTRDRLMPLQVFINNAPGGQWVLLDRNGALFAPEEAFDEWRLTRQPGIPPVQYRGQSWLPLATVSGYDAKFNYADQSVQLTFSPSAFEATHLRQQAAIRPQLTPATPAVFVNYDVSYTDSAYRNAPGDRQLGALTELGISGNAGVLTSSFVGQNLTASSQMQPRSFTRLETTFTRDYLDSDVTFKAGDSTTRRGLWGRPVYFGGIQLGTNFGLTPGFISQPIPILQGTSTAPSTVELYVNDVLRQTSAVPTGPFTIADFPLLTSSGDARMVVVDALGRQTVIDQPFFTHPSLLEEGLSDWSMEAGAARLNLGTQDFAYGQRFTSGMVRHGFSKSLTVDTQAEIGEQTRDGGVGVSYALPFLMMLGQAAASASDDRTAGQGYDWLVGLHRADLRHNFSATLERATIAYRQIAMGPGFLPYREQLSSNYSYTLQDNSGSLAAGVARIATYTAGTITTWSGNYSTRVAGNGSLTYSVASIVGSTHGFSIGVSALMPLDRMTNLTGGVTHKNGGYNEGYVGASKNLGNDDGTGWRALAGNRSGQNYSEAGYYYQSDKGLLTSDAHASTNQQVVRLGAQGGIVMMDGHAFMTRRVQDSFALVEVPGYDGIGVHFQNTVWAHTDKDGIALLPRLLPYQRNSIQLDPSELPIGAELDNIEQVVVPAQRTGVKVVFPVRGGQGALIHIVMPGGEDAPPGSALTLEGDAEVFYVARRGEAFVTGMKRDNILHMTFSDKSCSFKVSLPPANPDSIPRVGPVTCNP